MQIKVEKESRIALMYSLEVAGWCSVQFLEGHWLGCCCLVHHRMQELEPLRAQPLETDTLYPYGPCPELTGVDHLASGCKYYNGM